MPFFDKYPQLEKELVPMMIEGIDTPYFTITTKNGASSYNTTPRNYPCVLASSSGVAIKCPKSDLNAWIEKITPVFMELFKLKNIPMKFGAKDYFSVTSDSDSNICSIHINISSIELDRLFESESKLYQESGKKNAIYTLENSKGIDSFFDIRPAIENAIFKESDYTEDSAEIYPVAYINEHKALCLVCKADDEKNANGFRNFYLLFEELCKKHNIIELLPKMTQYATERLVSDASGDILKFEFNISPADMEQLLLLESHTYTGYRSPNSINRLMDPDSADFKDGVICLFPALSMADGEYMPRNAGCNMSEVISVQLANYIKKYLMANSDISKKDFFGHHNSTLTSDALNIDEADIFAALTKCMNLAKHISHQSYDALTILNQSKTPEIQLTALNADSLRIYQRLSAVTSLELKELQSCEVPIAYFLDRLLEVMGNKISSLSTSDHAKTDPYTQKAIKKAEEAISKITGLKTAINSPSKSLSY